MTRTRTTARRGSQHQQQQQLIPEQQQQQQRQQYQQQQQQRQRAMAEARGAAESARLTALGSSLGPSLIRQPPTPSTHTIIQKLDVIIEKLNQLVGATRGVSVGADYRWRNTRRRGGKRKTRKSRKKRRKGKTKRRR